MSVFAECNDRLDMREQIAHIDNLIADAQEKQREYRMQPWQLAAVSGPPASAPSIMPN